MTWELIHTSVERDLDGRAGFGVAAITEGTPDPIRDALVTESDGSALHPAVARALVYRLVRVGGGVWPVLSSVARCGPDWSGRPNRVAHHLVLEPADRIEAGPAAIAACFPFESSVPQVGLRPRRSGTLEWAGVPQAIGVDGRWPSALARRLGVEGAQLAIALPQGADPLGVIGATLAQMPPTARWRVQWSTQGAVRGMPGASTLCCVASGAPGAIDLAHPPPAPAPAAPLPGVRVSRPSSGAISRPEAGAPGQRTDQPLELEDSTPSAQAPTRPLGGRTAEQETAPRALRCDRTSFALFIIAAAIALVAVVVLLW